MNIKTFLDWLVNLKVVPYGWLAKMSGWLGILIGVACLLGHPIPGFPCPDPALPLVAGGAVLGLSRRVGKYPTK